MLLNKNSNIIRIKSKIEYIKDEYLVIKKNLILNENFHKIQKRFMRKFINIDTKVVKDKVLFEFKDNTIFNQYKFDTNTFKAPNLKLGYLKNNSTLLKHIYNNVKNNFGIDSIPYEYNKYYQLHSKDFYRGSKHYILYKIINEDANSEYVEIAFTNLTSKNKQVLINYLDKQVNLDVQQVGTYSYEEYQGLLKAMIIIKIHKNNLYDFFNDEENINFYDVNYLGGWDNINKMKGFAYTILNSESTIRFNQEIHSIYVLTRVVEDYENKILYNSYIIKNKNLTYKAYED